MYYFFSFVNKKVDLENPGMYGSDYQRSLGLEEHICSHVWSPNIFKDGVRKEKNFLRSYWCVLDFDSEMKLHEAIDTFCDCQHIIGITKSHSHDHHKFRVCIPWDKPITSLALYRANIGRVINIHNSDVQCKDGARFFYPCKEIISTSKEGYTMEIRGISSVSSSPLPPASPLPKSLPRWVKGVLRYGCQDGTRNTTCYQIGADMAKAGFNIDEIVNIIMKSPIPIDETKKDEVLRAVKNGVDKWLRKN